MLNEAKHQLVKKTLQALVDAIPENISPTLSPTTLSHTIVDNKTCPSKAWVLLSGAKVRSCKGVGSKCIASIRSTC